MYDVECPGCGRIWNINDLVKPYAKVTGQWFIGAAAAFALAYGREDVGMTVAFVLCCVALGLAVTRVVWQHRTLKALEKLPYGPEEAEDPPEPGAPPEAGD